MILLSFLKMIFLPFILIIYFVSIAYNSNIIRIINGFLLKMFTAFNYLHSNGLMVFFNGNIVTMKKIKTTLLGL